MANCLLNGDQYVAKEAYVKGAYVAVRAVCCYGRYVKILSPYLTRLKNPPSVGFALARSRLIAVPHVIIGYDTVLHFSSVTTAASDGISATTALTNPTQVFEFNAVAWPRIGYPVNMNINVLGSLALVVAFPSDYLGEVFRYIHTDGNSYNGVFTSGDVNFGAGMRALWYFTEEPVLQEEKMFSLSSPNVHTGKNIVVYTSSSPLTLAGSVVDASNTSVIFTIASDGSILSYVPGRTLNGFSQLDDGDGFGRGYWIEAISSYTLPGVLPN